MNFIRFDPLCRWLSELNRYETKEELLRALEVEQVPVMRKRGRR